ncbi:MAG: family 20 glycosylhydrolase [Armatimonadetes bacterium]|nr:family 20 glycosylhydrolase [Armatimonadota bacterium]
MISTIALLFAWQTSPRPKVVPMPPLASQGAAQMFLPTETTISCGKGLERIGPVLAAEAKEAFGVTWKVETEQSGTIRLKIDKTMAPEEYHLTIGAHAIIEGGSYQAVAMATATLLQVVRPFKTGLVLPLNVIEDKPASAYRGLMIDVARKYHSIETLKQCVELCRFYKIRYLQLHLSDDQAFTFPSQAFPKINQDTQNGGPAYTRQQLEDLVQYADDRAVTIVPEIDLPGHSATLVRAMPELFKIAGTKPYEHGSTINFANPKAVEAVGTLIGEVCDVFKSSPYFHMGGDEADMTYADQNADFQAAFKQLDLPPKSQGELFRHFIGQVDDMVKKRGKQLIAWEGFTRNPDSKFPIPKDVLVMEFESAYYQPTDLLADGYTVINAAWTPLYVVNKHVWSPQKVYEWNPAMFGRFSNVYAATGWVAATDRKNILGAQICAWEQPEYLEITNLRRVVPAMSERIWNPAFNEGYDDFATRLKHTDELLGLLITPVNFTATGLDQPGPDDFDIPTFSKPITVELATKKKGDIRYTIDGTPPTADSPKYASAIAVSQTTTIRAAVFDGQTKSFESSTTYYFVPPKQPNLATNKRVYSSSGTQHPQEPQLAVDDNLDLTSSWWAGPAPQWLAVDLGKTYSVDRIELFPYWDGKRYYQYTIDVSPDGQNWTTLVDRSKNTTPATAQGDEHKFEARPIRFVKVNMLKGSANDSVHIVELRVWEAK